MAESSKPVDVVKIGAQLHEARIHAQPISQLTERYQSLTRPLAYAIQAHGIKLREQAGERVIGLKMGLTSKAKRDQMNLDAPLYGVLTDKMQVSNNSSFSLKGGIHPKIEPEIAFLINQDLKGKVNRDQVLKACGGVYAALEILDSRYTQFKYFSMEDVISDNSSSSHFILGPKLTDFHSLDLVNLELSMLVNGTLAQKGKSSDISGDPVNSVIELCELLSQNRQSLPAGSIVLAGAATLAVALEPGMKVELQTTNLAPVHISITE